MTFRWGVLLMLSLVAFAILGWFFRKPQEPQIPCALLSQQLAVRDKQLEAEIIQVMAGRGMTSKEAKLLQEERNAGQARMQGVKDGTVKCYIAPPSNDPLGHLPLR